MGRTILVETIFGENFANMHYSCFIPFKFVIWLFFPQQKKKFVFIVKKEYDK